jgi:hypothetical protein
MKVQANFDMAAIEKEIAQFTQKVVKITFNELMQIGLQFVIDARSKKSDNGYHEDAKDLVTAARLAGGNVDHGSAGGFNDQTGNLRSSIGFVIMHDGEIMHEDFTESLAGTDKATGVEKGKEYAKEIGEVYPKGWALITVAGMEYASYVEARGFDVITGSTLDAEVKLRAVMENVLLAFE